MKRNPLKNVSENINNCAIELFADSRVIVTDCKCVIDYSDEHIVLNLGRLNLKITGKNLVADSFVFGQTDIKGKIEKLEFV
ncbi:MAG: YabP/YqfC family sporulation protein [Clostridia bacterium]|nr:YabP/YqfC family sporulation protein [Clostridia bacterium]